MFKKFKIWWYKNKARSAYIEYVDLCQDAPCGVMMVRAYHKRASKCADQFNRCMDRLQELGEKAPTTRL